MLSNREKRRVYRHAYLPEHLVDYVCAINSAQPHLVDNHLCFTRDRHLLFVGYPLNRSLSPDIQSSFEKAVSTFQPTTATLFAESMGHPDAAIAIEAADNYYFLPLPPPAPPASLTDIMRRARKQIHLSTVTFGRGHQILIDEFCTAKKLPYRQQMIYQRIGHYCRTTPTVHLLQATCARRLVAFSIVDYGSAHHAFYQFHIHSATEPVPGCSALLFDKMLYHAQAQGKTGINLGLGTLPGIRGFKQQWGGRPFFVHRAVHMRFKTTIVEKMLDALNHNVPRQWH